MPICDVQSSADDSAQGVSNLGNPVFSCPRNVNTIGMAQTSSLTASEGVLYFAHVKLELQYFHFVFI